MSENPLETKENSASNPKTSTDIKFTSKPEVTNNNTFESLDLKSFTKKLGLNFQKNKDDLRKLYGIYNKSVVVLAEIKIYISDLNIQDYKSC
ncbi:unnamed protein product [Rhizophagus irregularis]|uniref:Uncharacterized protein n=1 Tax=Rhizophagus irregularis TaxID=588596 RepID=A0A2I1EEI5_9GLOM|nr:hypothetical protein RhiirB3_433858 [Rhizophagus irregularis]CAB4481019.1 unnamed protein product [Rhizophagus irregularis]CAB5388504.1 unnamed protein product [Rhizophagus irregularis]